jgi:hypothetical protein
MTTLERGHQVDQRGRDFDTDFVGCSRRNHEPGVGGGT